MDKKYYANGKLLITGEYLVMEGALALAVPTVLGQEMIIRQGDSGTGRERISGEGGMLTWISHYNEERWFEAKFSLTEPEVISSNKADSAAYIQRIIKEASKMNPEILAALTGLNITTHMNFSPVWGLGSSSSLLYNIASLFGIDPYQLFFKTQNGSGYDIACAAAKGPIFYNLASGQPSITEVSFDPPFKENIAFIYTGKKQDTRQSVQEFKQKSGFNEYQKGSISQISREIVNAPSTHDFCMLMDEHEAIMSNVLDLEMIKTSLFDDFPGSIKSLGSWGGDFIMAVSEFGFEEIKLYFSAKGLDIIYKFDDLVLRPDA